MSELALYRKYRPQKFSEVIGQDHVVDVLKGAIDNAKVAHAYLFSGSRGTGKTSIARIFARELGVKEADLYEIDGASNTGVDNIRELRDTVHTLPFDSPYKVYLIDEVHMLSKGAFNALLKTLEEPPKHVIFMFATTEAHKVPETVISRCQTFILRTPTESVLEKALTRVAKGEGVSIDKPSLTLLALLGDGSFRDAIGNLQKVISFSGDTKITVEEVEKITGAPTSDRVLSFIEAMGAKDVDAALQCLGDLVRTTVDLTIFSKLVLVRVREIILLAVSKEMAAVVKEEVTDSEWKRLETLSRMDVTFWLSVLRELLAAYDDLKGAVIKQLPLELLVIRILTERPLEK